MILHARRGRGAPVSHQIRVGEDEDDGQVNFAQSDAGRPATSKRALKPIRPQKRIRTASDIRKRIEELESSAGVPLGQINFTFTDATRHLLAPGMSWPVSRKRSTPDS